MSDMVIRGMEMPKSCLDEKSVNDCPIVGICQIYKNTPYPEKRDKFFEQRLEGCPLVELPPHGDLKDYNNILSIFDKVLHDTDDKTCALLCDILVQIYYAPTKLEASKC